MAGRDIGEQVAEVLDAFDVPGTSVAALVRRTLRIATQRGDYQAQMRLLLETFDLRTPAKVNSPQLVEARRNLEALLGHEGAVQEQVAIMDRYSRARTIPSEPKGMRAESIAALEAYLQSLLEMRAGASTPPPPQVTGYDAMRMVQEQQKVVGILIPAIHDAQTIVERVRQDVYDVLLQMEQQITAGQRRPGLFERAREYIEDALAARAPSALTMFRAAEQALEEAPSSEQMVHALTSCRRMIEALADALYPATGQQIVGIDGRTREMTQAQFRNRLLQFANEKLESRTHGKLLESTLQSLGGRLERLVDMTNKGVHDEVSRAEAETCVMWTYLTAADFLRLDDGSLALVDEAAPVAPNAGGPTPQS